MSLKKSMTMTLSTYIKGYENDFYRIISDRLTTENCKNLAAALGDNDLAKYEVDGVSECRKHICALLRQHVGNNFTVDGLVKALLVAGMQNTLHELDAKR